VGLNQTRPHVDRKRQSEGRGTGDTRTPRPVDLYPMMRHRSAAEAFE
jgi:hypothetical protein